MFLPTVKTELRDLGWNRLDVIIISGDTYIDSAYSGAAVIGKVLLNAGYKVGIIAQPEIRSDIDITRLGEPRLFWGITGGCVDSMVANFTASMKRRRKDDFTPGGHNNRRPDRAVIVYSNLIRRFFKKTKPIVLGGIEASLRRIAHYDYWDDMIRRSILFDAKGDVLVYGMGEKGVIEVAGLISGGLNSDSAGSATGMEKIRGICYISKYPRKDYIQLPSFHQVSSDKNKFIEMFHLFYRNNDPLTAKGLCQQYGDRYLIQNPPAQILSETEIDSIYDLGYERDVHPFYKKNGEVRALSTIKYSIPSHRGCYGECNFCAISVHQGTSVVSRSRHSIVREAKTLSASPDFKGYIHDIGGPTANMYGTWCNKMKKYGKCQGKDCIYPEVCRALNKNHRRQIELLGELRKIERVKKVFVASGIRYDMILDDGESGEEYLNALIKHHISGQLKLAPEHTEYKILELMRKPVIRNLAEFKKRFDRIDDRRKKGKPIKPNRGVSGDRSGRGFKKSNQFLTYYLIAAHPGCSGEDQLKMKRYISKELRIIPEQVQIFTPSPSTYSTLMYYTELNPWTGEKIFVEKNIRNKEQQKKIITTRSTTIPS